MLYKAKSDKDIGVKGCQIIGREIPLGYELTESFFVDNSGFGDRGETALVFADFLDKVKAGRYYGIQEAGQFQVYIGEFKKVNRKKALTEAGIISSKLIKNNTRLTIFKNGDKILRLHNTDIIKWQGGRIVLNSGGWDTLTTRARFNEFLPDNVKVVKVKGITYVKYDNLNREFFDGIEL